MLDFPSLYRFIGERIRAIRESQSPPMSQGRLAEILGLERTSVTNIESGKQKPTLETLYRFCDRFSLEIRELLPDVSAVRTPEEQSIVIGGEAHAMGSKTASVVERLRPTNRTQD